MAAYMLTSTTRDDEVLEVYARLSRMLTRKPDKYTLVGGGDFNADVGSTAMGTSTALGPRGPQKRNERGSMLINWCEEEGLAITNTWTTQSNKTTWTHPRFGSEHVLDYF